MELIGWLGAFLFAICGFPQALKSYQDGHSRGLSWGFLLAWAGGEILTILYVLPKMDLPLLTNYFVNAIFLSVMLRYKIWERENVVRES